MKQIKIIDPENEPSTVNKGDLIILKGSSITTGTEVVAKVRSVGEFRNNAIYLYEKYNWHIGTDSEGLIVAVPTRKK